jgi:hypothetical protein
MRRRDLLFGTAGAGLARLDAAPAVPIRAITSPPLNHWFGYYDKLQFDPDSRYALGIGNNFQHRLPTADDFVHIGMIDLKDKDRWIDLGRSYAWSWHQGSMLWLGIKEDVIWNERQDGRFVARIMNVKSRKSRIIPSAICCVSRAAGRRQRFRAVVEHAPETGYAAGDPFAAEPRRQDRASGIDSRQESAT